MYQHYGESFLILALYVDDIIMASNNSPMLQKEKLQLNKKFDISDQGEVH